jgi:hypothetical protein
MLVPEGISYKYDLFVRRYRVILILSFLVILILYITFLFYKVNNDLYAGENLSEKESLMLLDSCAVGVDRYKAINGSYPPINGKYFFNSIKLLVYIDEVYIYLSDKNATDLMRSNYDRDSLLSKDSLVVGIGSSKQYLTYKYLNKDHYMLYSVGENGIDESGNGDDFVYNP